MSRSSWKGFYIDPILDEKFEEHKKRVEERQKKSKRKVQPVLKTDRRSATILPKHVGFKFAIHNGRTAPLQKIVVTEEMVGRKLGEFSFTRKATVHKAKTKKKK